MPSRFGAGFYGKTLYSAGYVYAASGSFAILTGFAGSAFLPVDASGTMTIRFGFAGLANAALAVSGELPIVPVWEGRAVGVFVASGEMDMRFAMPAAAAVAGPLWGQDEPCAGQWGPDALCADPGWAPDPDLPASPPWGPSELCDG